MTSSPQTVQSIYQALTQGSLAKVLMLLSEQVVLHQATSLPYGGTFHGREGFIASLTLLSSTWETYRKTPQLFLANGDDIAVLGELQAKGHGIVKGLITPFTDHWKLWDGKVIEIRLFDWDTAQLLFYLEQTSTKK
jgi:ketosteroid isomerase-like protein